LECPICGQSKNSLIFFGVPVDISTVSRCRVLYMTTIEEREANWIAANVSNEKPIIKWWVTPSGSRERMRHANTMVGIWAYDATCSCGWDSRTQGIKSEIQRQVRDHKDYYHDYPQQEETA
jgi:hypothetical protein